jgi:Domain of unknown function (DUF4430)
VSRLALLALALVLAGCGGDARGAGTATLWVTRDRGAHVLYEGEVPAGLTAMQALDRRLDVDTRYGGRFVQAIDGLEGDAARQRDWFWYVNGIEGDRSAGEYRLHPGDVEWWDYRSWKQQMRVPVVVGAFPEPFLHGYGGKRGGVEIVLDQVGRGVVDPNSVPVVRKLKRIVHASDGHGRPDYVLLIGGNRPFQARRSDGAIVFTINARDARRLADHPDLAKMRFEGLRR